MAREEVDSKADHKLVSELFELSKRNKKLVHSSTYSAPSMPEMTVRSWKMNEFKYYDVPSPFPTLARGLFTTWVPDDAGSEVGDEKGVHRIVARGYDKFFNIGEVPWTYWDALRKHTVAPYTMTLKSNGCIIFIAALSPSKLVITSKHSLGPVENAKVSHAQMGEIWLEKHIKSKEKTTEQLAQVLWDNNWTAVAELCDDSFEEHVLPYSPEKTGLHLHGINHSTGAFRTLTSDKVAEFAREWGFIETAFHVVNSVDEVKSFSEEIAKSGKWNGEPIEGFVVRCHVGPEATKDRNAPPYPPGSSFFFKVKYDEPYMMYRDWREITKSLLAAKGPVREATVPKSKLRRPESHIYLKWIKEEIIQDRKQFDGFGKGKGIIATRERFLKWLSENDAVKSQSEQLTKEMAEMDIRGNQEKEFGKTIIVPVAIPGCGKTTVAVALRHLFSFGHVQSDDVKAKKAAPIFIRNVMDQLTTHDVVIADKNNHLKQHRSSLREAVQQLRPPVRLLALNWALDKPPAIIHRICGDRVMDRGDNHQTLIADAVAKKHEEVIWMFIQKTEELEANEVDEIIEMEIEEDLEQCLDRAVDACVRILGVKKPSQEDIGKALAAARGYTPARKAEVPRTKKKDPEPRYYGLLPEFNLKDVVGNRLAEEDAPKEARELWMSMMMQKRITDVPHVTIVHFKSLPNEQELWDRCRDLFIHISTPTFAFELGHLVFNDRLMALTIENLKAAANPDEDTSKEAVEFVDLLDENVKKLLHITVGTKSKDVNPFEARTFIEKWRAGEVADSISALALKDVIVKGRVKGLFH